MDRDRVLSVDIGGSAIDGATYSQYVSQAALERTGVEEWRRRCGEVLDRLRGLFLPDRLFVGGGNARLLAADQLGSDVTIVANEVALRGGGLIGANRSAARRADSG